MLVYKVKILNYEYTIRWILISYDKIQFRAVGMYCTTCKPIVENQLRNNKGIKKIDIDYMTDRVIIEFDL
ncbi:heavy-metal-associated domain-containing protein [Candidatus Nitrosocosmicus franklandus]|uniref:HMA domain-containing protein n=1 Tax=Candidatus Nitrosocosmicus franklandianus TaxID=1798806 RepID=A0A484IB10_9ARCH|nr:protein of unknown function [Candidatus Nitrosocosmicus franklandus]